MKGMHTVCLKDSKEIHWLKYKTFHKGPAREWGRGSKRDKVRCERQVAYRWRRGQGSRHSTAMRIYNRGTFWRLVVWTSDRNHTHWDANKATSKLNTQNPWHRNGDYSMNMEWVINIELLQLTNRKNHSEIDLYLRDRLIVFSLKQRIVKISLEVTLG